jgi:hypothetical protein
MAHIRIESPGIAAKVSPIWSVITNACLHGIRSASSTISRHQYPFTDVFVAMQGRRRARRSSRRTRDAADRGRVRLRVDLWLGGGIVAASNGAAQLQKTILDFLR